MEERKQAQRIHALVALNEQKDARIAMLEVSLAVADDRNDELEDALESNPRAGREAEEIRRALEGMQEDIAAVIDDTDTAVLSEMLETVSDRIGSILEEVDARDALAYLEERKAAEKALAGAREDLRVFNLVLPVGTCIRCGQEARTYDAGNDERMCLSCARKERAALAERIAAVREDYRGESIAAHDAQVQRDHSQQKRQEAEGALAAARELLARIVKYAVEDRACTPGSTRLARAILEARRLLGIPDGDLLAAADGRRP